LILYFLCDWNEITCHQKGERWELLSKIIKLETETKKVLASKITPVSERVDRYLA